MRGVSPSARERLFGAWTHSQWDEHRFRWLGQARLQPEKWEPVFGSSCGTVRKVTSRSG